MTLTLDELRTTLVERWYVLSSRKWDAVVASATDVPSALVILKDTIRFRRTSGDIPYVTPFQQRALTTGTAASLVVTLNGLKYVKLDHLGSGGQGLVWIACPCNPRVKANELVALKIPNPAARNPQAAVTAVEREIQILTQIQPCQSIASLTAVDTAGPTLATRLVDGLSLEAWLARTKRFPIARAVRIGIDLCGAVEELHACNHLHKDIKPSNVIDEFGKTAVLIDFGLAEQVNQNTHARSGTPFYIAPEVLSSDPNVVVDERADVFSLGATLYTLLAGRPPHFNHCLDWTYRSNRTHLDRRQFLGVDAAHACDLERVRPGTPRRLAELIDRALSTRPDRRPRVSEVRRELTAVAATLAGVNAVEERHWKIADLLIHAYQEVHRDPDYDNLHWENAARIVADLETRILPLTADLAQAAGGWDGYPAPFQSVTRTRGMTNRVEVAVQQLREYLDSHRTPVTRHPDATLLLKDLIVRALENIRAASFDAVAGANEWRTVADLYGTRATATATF